MGRDHGSAAKCCATALNREGNDLGTDGSTDGFDDIVSETMNGGRVAPALLFVPVQVHLPGLSQHGAVLGRQAISAQSAAASLRTICPVATVIQILARV